MARHQRFLLSSIIFIAMLGGAYIWTGWYRARYALPSFLAAIVVAAVAATVVSLRLWASDRK